MISYYFSIGSYRTTYSTYIYTVHIPEGGIRVLFRTIDAESEITRFEPRMSDYFDHFFILNIVRTALSYVFYFELVFLIYEI